MGEGLLQRCHAMIWKFELKSIGHDLKLLKLNVFEQLG